MATGLEMMLKSMGIDVGAIIHDFEQLKDGILQTLTKIDARLERIEKEQGEIWLMIQQQERRQQNMQQQPQPKPQQQQQPPPQQQKLQQPQPPQLSE